VTADVSVLSYLSDCEDGFVLWDSEAALVTCYYFEDE
jgi:hypothetical protein